LRVPWWRGGNAERHTRNTERDVPPPGFAGTVDFRYRLRMDVSTLQGKTVLVSGAASGIGRETALACARRGARLVICDLDERGLEATAAEITALGCAVTARRVDVADRAAMAAFAAAVHAEVEAVDLLVNNAGVAIGGGFLHTSLEDWEWIVSINVMGVVHGCHYFLPAMVARGRGGHVVNVASGAGYVASGALAAYSTTKFAVVGLSEALRDELLPHGIGVTAICPGLINTPITRSARMRGPDGTPERRQQLIQIYERRNYTPARVAAGILHAVQRNRAVAPVTPEAWALYYLKRLSPGLVAWIGRAAQARARRRAL
jgi:NAD(P)-dependent dehydrogenase (short-subunit alcohol dehydrogenase family)